jgi:hypothetical protein
MKQQRTSAKKHLYKLPLLMTCLIIAGISLLPLLVPREAGAYGQITSRSLTISSGVPAKTNVTYTFTFTVPSTTQVESLKFIACTNAVSTYPNNGGSCTAPTGLSFSSATFGSQSGWQGATNFAVDGTGANDCSPAANILCANRTDTTSQTATSRTIAFSTITNPSTPNTSFYVGIHTYSDIAYTGANRVDFGATASAVVQTLTTNAAVAEVLNFCVGATTIDDTTTNVANDCSALSGTSINIGTLDTSTVNISPVTINGGDSQNGVAMVRSNAGNGTVIAYDAIQQSGSNHQGTLRISGATCSAASGPGTGSPPAASGPFTDGCIDAAGGTQNAFTPGSEEFGMTIAGINSGSTTSYACTYGSPPGNTCNMRPLSNYLGAGTSGSSEAYGTTNGFAWDESGTAINIASSASSTVKQVDDEALVLKYAATPSITTPFGPYAAQTDFIAVPTY